MQKWGFLDCKKHTDPHTMKQEESLALTLEPARVNNIIRQLSRAIYYHHYKEKLIGNVKYQAEFMATTTDPSEMQNNKFSVEADIIFQNAPYFGENSEVFKYQVIENEESKTMRLYFYEGCRLLLMFNGK